jgi:hypothetical protein
MSPEKTIRWAAALFAFPFFLLLGEYIPEAASGHTLQINNLAITTIVLALPACLVAFSSRVAAAISLIFWCLLSIALLPSPIRALMGGQLHLLATKVKVVSMISYSVATAAILFSAFRAAQDIQRRKKGPDPASVFE